MVGFSLLCGIWRVKNDLARMHLVSGLAVEGDPIENGFEVVFKKLSVECDFVRMGGHPDHLRANPRVRK